MLHGSAARWVVWLLAAGLGPLARHGAPEARTGDSEAAYQRQLEKLERTVANGGWKGVAEELDELLEAHRGAPYVAPTIFQLREAYDGAAFNELAAGEPRPTPKTLVGGELVSYRERKEDAEIKVRYAELAPGDDFQLEGSGGERFLRHPVVLLEEFDLEFHGRLVGGDGPPAVFILGDELSWVVSLGTPVPQYGKYYPARIIELDADGEQRIVVQEDNASISNGSGNEVRIASGSGRLRVFCNGDLVMERKTKPSVRGSLGLQGFDRKCELEIRGRVSSAWIQGLVDEANARLRARFEAGYDPSAHGPDWLDELYRKGANADPRPFPDPEQAANAQAWTRLAPLFTRERAGDALEQLAQPSEPEPSPAFRAYAGALLLGLLDRLDEARTESARARALAEGSRRAALLAAGLEAHEVDPGLLIAVCLGSARGLDDYRLLARQLLESSRLRSARTLVEVGILSGVAPADLADVQDLLARALDGPRWAGAHEYRTVNYRVRSDIDRRVCFEIAQELEQSLRLYNRDLIRQTAAEKRAEPYPVYVFSGEEGYLAHLEGLFGERRENTAGVYSPTLKQLLVWNLPDRESLMRTVRHEGLHQYLDAVLRDPPRWLDEGMAEYFETAEFLNGRRRAGAPNGSHAAFLLDDRTRWAPFDRLLGADYRSFYSQDVALHYAQSWALVHYLLHSDRHTTARFGDYFDELRAGDPGPEAFAELFGDREGDPFDELEAKVRAHLGSLR